jgi:hypothetical protein
MRCRWSSSRLPLSNGVAFAVGCYQINLNLIYNNDLRQYGRLRPTPVTIVVPSLHIVAMFVINTVRYRTWQARRLQEDKKKLQKVGRGNQSLAHLME